MKNVLAIPDTDLMPARMINLDKVCVVYKKSDTRLGFVFDNDENEETLVFDSEEMRNQAYDNFLKQVKMLGCMIGL